MQSLYLRRTLAEPACIGKRIGIKEIMSQYTPARPPKRSLRARDKADGESGYLTGQCLVAMPTLHDPNFARAVVFVCAHSKEGAMGIIVNRPMDELAFPDILEQLGIAPSIYCGAIAVHSGGPIEAERGFVLHSAEYHHPETLTVDTAVALTATPDVLRAIAQGSGPRHSLMALGYAGWGAGQLDAELKENSWLTVAPDTRLLFGPGTEEKWLHAVEKLGIKPGMLNESAGHA